MSSTRNISVQWPIALTAIAVSLGGPAAMCESAAAAEFMFRARVDGRMLEGKPLTWTKQEIQLLGRDGRLYYFHPKEAKESVKTSPRFFGYSQSEMKTALQQEFDKRFDVSATRHFLIVHPSGERDLWAQRFEDLYNRFCHYFRVRGFSLSEPPYPLVAVVYRNQAEYIKEISASGTPPHPNTLGHYDPTTNRVYLFDASKDAGYEWSENATTIIHEATHQTANNVGVHRRFSDVPRWVVEGLATMFEAPGVWNAQYDRTREDRINRERLRGFRDYVVTRRKPDSLPLLLTSDQPFRTDSFAAYAEAWALSFYLSETQPRLYTAYLAKTASRPLFVKYTAAERLADFQDVFGSEMKMFDVKFLRFMEEL